MLTLSSTLLAAQRQATPPPATVRLVVRDLWNRWSPLFNAGQANPNQSAACWDATRARPFRARIDASGNLQTQVITDMAVEAQWETWTTRQTGVYLGDVACSDNGGTLRVFYLRREGAASPYTWRVKYIESADGGSSWGAEQEVESISHASPYGGLSSPGSHVLVLQRPEGTVRLRIYAGGSWGAPDDWADSPTVGTGIAAVGDQVALYCLVAGTFAGTARVRLATWLTGDGWADGGDIAPVGSTQANFAVRWPTLARKAGGDDYALGWIEDINAGGLDSATLVLTTAYVQANETQARVSPNLAVDQANPRRANLIYDAVNGRWLLCGEVGIHAATAYDAAATGKNLTLNEVAAYRLADSRHGATGEVEIYDPARNTIGWQAGALRPLAMLTLERGYMTAAGAERAPTSPLFLMAAGYRRDGKKERFCLRAVDGWHLLDLWRAPHAYQWSNISIALLAQRLVKFVGPWGLSYDGTNGKWNTVLSAFAIAPGETLRAALARLLSLIGATLLWQALNTYPYGQWKAVIWPDTPGSSVYAYQYASVDPARHPYYKDWLTCGAPIDTQVRAFGPGAGTNYSGAAESELLGRDVYAFASTRHLDSASELQGLAAGIWQAGQAAQAGGYIISHPNVGLQVGDVISLYDGALGYNPIIRRVASLAERYDAEAGLYEQRVEVEDV
jgi:hypothetical protein